MVQIWANILKCTWTWFLHGFPGCNPVRWKRKWSSVWRLPHTLWNPVISVREEGGHWGRGSRMYRIITCAAGLCSLPSPLISSGEQKEYWVLVLTGNTGPYKVCSHSCDLSFCHFSELTVKPSVEGVTSRWNITGAAEIDCRVCFGSFSDLGSYAPVFLHMIYVSSYCISAGLFNRQTFRFRG